MKGKVYYVNTGCYIHGTVRYPREAQVRTHRPTPSTYLKSNGLEQNLFRDILSKQSSPFRIVD